jgi:hypothetical protein
VAFAGGWVFLGLVNVLAVELSGSDSPSMVRLARHGFDLGRHAAAGLTVVLILWAWRRAVRPSRVIDMMALWVGASVVGVILLPEDVAGFASRMGEDLGLPQALMLLMGILGTAASIPAATLVGGALAHGPWRMAALVVVLVGVAINGVIFAHDNPGLHFFLSWFLAQLAAHSLRSPMVALLRGARRNAITRAMTPPLVVVIVVWAASSVAVRPSNAVVLELGRWHGSLLSSHISRLHAQDEPAVIEEQIPVERENPFFVDRSGLEAVEASTPRLLADDAIVLFITIDALRFDLLADPRYEEYVPTLDMLRRRGTSFHAARAPGSQTVYTMSAMSTGRHFSQRYWSEFKGDLWPHEDDSIHFAELLTQNGVRCVMVPGARWMAEAYGVMRGFEGSDAVTRRKWVHGTDMTDGILSVLKSEHAGPLLVYAHYLDSHAPYNRGGTDCEKFECYLREIQWVDRELGRVVSGIEAAGLSSRVTLIVSSDHGEAFGEHGATLHASTLYDELLRVPLIVVGPNIEAREIDELVSLIDMGPTLLDLFGVATPAQFMGESLVPFLRGESPALERPIVAEGRLKRTMVFGDGIKVIRDLRARTTEIYDLEEDPLELEDRSESTEDVSTSEHVRRLRQFFSVHTLQREGYETPYRK